MQENTVATAPAPAPQMSLEALRAQGAVARSLTRIEQQFREAAYVAVHEGFPAAGELIDQFLQGELQALMQRVTPLLAVRGVPPMEQQHQERLARLARECQSPSAGGSQPD